MTVLPLSRPVDVRRLARDGDILMIDADAGERAALARDLGIPAIERLHAEITVTPARGGARVRGHVSATVVQTCVVTLDPFETAIEEDIDLRFKRQAAAAPTGEIDLDASGPDGPEPLEGDIIDVGALAAEHLALGLDLYPRKPGVAFDDIVEAPDEPAKQSPFAGLAGLVRKP
ncbi:DUF177 domain-containing protein [Pseudoxanthobacter sp. M-2]|uniref:YceD family protein n=1 Tax=Pseudoxanthobacter sp. M-2 TaxID=3078754 RepID=UPI0038FC039D